MWQEVWATKKWQILLIADLVLVNLALVFLGLNRPSVPVAQNGAGELASGQGSKEVVRDVCGPECQAYIDQKFSGLPQTSVRPQPSATPSPTAKSSVPAVSPKPTKIRRISYMAVPGSGSTTANDWTDLSGTEFYFDPVDYPGLVEVYFEANANLFNGNGAAYVRLYDATHKIGVQGGEVSTTSQTSTVIVSGRVTFWSGRNLIRVQAKSLTADTAVFNSGRLKVVTEN